MLTFDLYGAAYGVYENIKCEFITFNYIKDL